MFRTGDENVDRVVRQVVRSTDKARADQHAKGKNVTVSTSGAGGDKTVSHGLGYKPTQFPQQSQSGVSKVSYSLVSADSRRATFNFTSGTAEVVIRCF